MMKSRKILVPSIILSLLLFPIVASHYVTVEFWTDKEMNNKYHNEFLWVYLQNKTFEVGEISYNVTCYRGQYANGLANVSVPTGYYDLLAVDGAITWNNETDCPDRVENYDIWATAQSNLYVDSDMELDYFVNTTLIAPPRQYFWNLYSFRMILSVIAWIVILGIIIAVAYWTHSGFACVIVFLILLAIKLLIGI